MNDFLLDKYTAEYNNLNREQKDAVDTIEGPVMVIAGAGTGKTQTIALRIANILLKTQTPPQNILCLTFTDTGTIAMRQRLTKIIGSDAYKIKIHTFHSFCNEVIKNNPDYFIFAKNIDSLEEVEKVEIIQSLIQALPNGSLLKPWGDNFYYQYDIISSIQTLKREGIKIPDLEKLASSQQNFIDKNTDVVEQFKAIKFSKNVESDVLAQFHKILENSQSLSEQIFKHLFFLEQKYNQGAFEVGAAKSPAVNFKNELIKFFGNLVKDTAKQKELAQVYQGYQEELVKRGRYDFDDMVLFVLDSFKTNPELLSIYQEKYQYILVDEYQDTNTAQNSIIELLGSYYENPNIFVVGDDDQSIFRFQGASIENIYNFYQKYNPKLIVLKNNYRSHRLILDSSASVIKNNKNRITSFIDKIDKSLVSQATHDPTPINLLNASNLLEESYFVASKIKELLASGVDPKEIAVLYRNNHDVDDLAEYLKNLNIKYYLSLNSNILDHQYIKQLLNLLEFINNPESSDLLYRILSSDYLQISALDLFKIIHHSRSQKINLSALIFSRKNFEKISSELSPKTCLKIKNFRIRIAKSRKWIENNNLDYCFNKIIRRFGYLNFILSQSNLEIINFLNTFYTEVKRSSLIKNHDLTQFLRHINLLIENNLPINAPEIPSESANSIKLMTVHKSKGLEFEHVFLYRCLDKKWGNNPGRGNLRLPLGILKTDIVTVDSNENNEDERRLFYVALTRAKKQIYITFSSKNESGRDQVPSMFVSEIDPSMIEKIEVDKNLFETALINMFPPVLPNVSREQDFNDYLSEHLKKQYKFNVSHLNSYLRCPFCFYHKTILRMPSAKNKPSSFGSAVHAALGFLIDTYRQDKVLISKDKFISEFEVSLKKENLNNEDEQSCLFLGNSLLADYYQNYKDIWVQNCLSEYDFAPNHVYLDDIPITGKIDKIEILPEKIGGKNCVEVVDFKTGNPDDKYKELSKDGDYFRQLVFYKILADLDTNFQYHVSKGSIDFIQKSKTRNKFIKTQFEFSPEDIETVKNTIREVYQKIMNLEFNILGEECKDRDHLHSLFKK